MEKSGYQRICLFLSRGCIWQIFLLIDKKKADKKIYIQTEKINYINYYLIVPIDRAPQRLHSQRYSYRWRNI